MLLHAALCASLALTSTAPGDELLDRVRATLAGDLLTLDPTSHAGPAFDRLVEEGRRAELFLVAESHGNQETPAVTTLLLHELAEEGYGSYAIETGPLSARVLASVLEDGGPEAFAGWSQRFPMGIAFMNWEEEVRCTADALAAGYELYGLDQEFAGSGRHHLERLIELGPDGDTRALADGLLAQALDGFAHFMETRDQSRTFLTTADAAVFSALRGGFEGETEALEIVDELEISGRIYGHYAAGRYFENNRDRIVLMKRNFRHMLEAVAARPEGERKVLLRFGAAHMGRGYSPYRQLDLGNHAAERAVARGGESYHLYIVSRSMLGEGSPLAALSPLFKGDQAALVDLRRVRGMLSGNRGTTELRPLQDTVFRYDALLVYPSFTASTEIVPFSR